MAYVFSIVSEVLPRADVIGFRGTEAVSRPFAFQIAIRVEGEIGDPAEIVHEPLALEIQSELGTQRVAGIASAAKIVHVDKNGGLLRLDLVPTFWRTTLSRHNRVFTDVSIPEIVEAVLREDGVTNVDQRLVDTYPVREHVGQFKESNFAFVSRLLEREGIFYFFEHDGETDKLVIADHPSAFAVSRERGVPYRPGVEGGASFGESFFSLAMKRAALPKDVLLTDWNYRTPQVKVTGERSVAKTTPGRIVRHGDNVLDPDEAARYARIRAEELAAQETTFFASGPVSFLVSGGRFTVEEHPREALNRELVAIAIEHVGTRTTNDSALIDRILKLPKDISYRAKVVAIPSDAPYRPARSTPRPEVQGLVDGVVDGAATSEYAQIDEHGRYKVRLKLDEGDPIDGSNSTWIRMLQPHGGGTEGFHFPLRKGTEVHVAFTYGDPDRPIVVGVAHNPERPSMVTAGNHTQNVIQTGGKNRIEIEDLKGKQRFDIRCPTLDSYLHLGHGTYQFEGNTKGEGWIYTGGDLEITVDGHKTEDVLENVTETYKSTQNLTVHGAVDETMQTSRDTKVTGPQTNTWKGPLGETVELAVTETYNTGLETTVGSDTKLTYDLGETITVTGGVTEIYQSNHETTVTGSLKHHAGPTFELFGASASRTVDTNQVVRVDGAMTVVAPKFEGAIASWTNLDDANKNHIEDIVKELINLKIKLYALKIEIQLVKRTKNGVKIEGKGAEATASGCKITYKNVKSTDNADRDEKDGAYLRLEGANLMMKTLAILG